MAMSKKITDKLPCARCKRPTTDFYDAGKRSRIDYGTVHMRVKMCQMCTDAGWRPWMLWAKTMSSPIVLTILQTAEPVSAK